MTEAVAVISGANGNLATSVIEVFKAANYRLALLVRSERAQQTLAQAHPDAFVVQADLSNADETNTMIKAVLRHYGRIDSLIHLTGGFAMQDALSTSAELIHKQLEINFWTLVNLTQACLAPMQAAKRGVIIGIGAAPAVRGGNNVTAYAASKGALIGYLRALRTEVEKDNIGVSIVYPMGTIDTPANRAAMPDANPETWIDPQQIAHSLLYLSNSNPRGRTPELMIQSGN